VLVGVSGIASVVNYLPIKEFNDEDYEYDALNINNLLIGKGVWDIIKDGYVELDWSTLPQADRPDKRGPNEEFLYYIPYLINLVLEVIPKDC